MITPNMEHFEALYPENSRFEEIERILSFIKEGNSVQLVSLPGVGRSNLLGLLSYNTKVRLKHLGENQKWFHFVYLNFSEVRGKPILEATKFIFIGFLDSLLERKKEEEHRQVNKILKESLKFNDPLVLFSGLKKTIDYLAIERELNIIFLFDRFETYVPSLTPEFFSNLRILRNRAKYRFSCIFSLNRPLEETLEKEILADFYEFVVGHVVFLPLFDKPGLDFRISYLEKSKGQKLNRKILDEILSLTGGHGKLTRLCAEAYLAFSNQRLASSSGLKNFLLSQKPVLGSMLEIWLSLTPPEQNLLKSTHSINSGQASSSYLENVGLLRNGKVTIPLFEEYLRQVPKTQDIKSLLDSDQLTLLESKLLKFLIGNPDRIIERDEIVVNVWGDLKTTEGVTEQALDQLIFRLRKKIENDPNNPVFLQTIKGRGFKFID